MEWREMTLTVEQIDSSRGGDIYVYIFLEEGFPIKHNKAVRNYRFSATKRSHSLRIAVPDSSFAIKVHHDQDRSGKVTKNWTGILPAEGLGFSSGARLGFGPPSFKDAVIRKPDSDKVSIKVIYP